jgi:hypothetical protein
MNSINLNSLPLVGGTSIASTSTPETTSASTLEATGLPIVGGSVIASAPVATVSSTSLVDALKALNPSTAVTAPVAKSAEDVKQLNRVIYLSTLGNDGKSLTEKYAELNISQMGLVKNMKAIDALLFDLEPDSPTYQTLSFRKGVLEAMYEQTKEDRKNIEAFDDQVDKELEAQGTPFVESEAVKPIDEAIKKSFELADKEEVNSSAYKAIATKIKTLSKKRHALVLEANPKHDQISKAIGDKNKVALENGTHEFSDIRQRKISTALGKNYSLLANLAPETSTFNSLLDKTAALEALYFSIDLEKTNPIVSKMYQDLSSIQLKASTVDSNTLDSKNPEYLNLMHKGMSLKANIKSVEYAESNPALSSSWKKEAELYLGLEGLGRKSPEYRVIIAQLDKLQIERQKIPTTPVTSANTETPTETSINLPVMI